jgi:hypothetical protein
MFWEGLRLSTEYVLGAFHCVLRARRADSGGAPVWDELWRGLLNPPGDIEEHDLPAWILLQLGQDLVCLEPETGP